MTTPLCLYHANCADGACAAWVVRHRFPNAECRAVSYDSPDYLIIPETRGRDVYVVDFSFSLKTMQAIARTSRSLTVIDHHKTARDAIAELVGFDGNDEWFNVGRHPAAIFDQGRSGAGLTWDTLFPWSPLPWFVAYVEDRDLWRWELPDSREVNAYIGSFPAGPDGFLFGVVLHGLHDAHHIGNAISEGRAILRVEDRMIDEICANARFAWPHLPGGVVVVTDRWPDGIPTVNTPVLRSEAAHRLAEGAPFAVAWYEDDDGNRRYSLRSDENGLDVSEIAKAFGGGGHKHAAGFTIKKESKCAF